MTRRCLWFGSALQLKESILCVEGDPARLYAVSSRPVLALAATNSQEPGGSSSRSRFPYLSLYSCPFGATPFTWNQGSPFRRESSCVYNTFLNHRSLLAGLPPPSPFKVYVAKVTSVSTRNHSRQSQLNTIPFYRFSSQLPQFTFCRCCYRCVKAFYYSIITIIIIIIVIIYIFHFLLSLRVLSRSLPLVVWK